MGSLCQGGCPLLILTNYGGIMHRIIMHRIRLVVSLVLAGTALSASAALQFTNVPGFGGTSALTAAAYDGTSRFLAAGNNSTTLLVTFTNGQMKWAPPVTMPLSSTSLRAAARSEERRVG